MKPETRTRRKLQLSAETIRELSSEDLSKVAGGMMCDDSIGEGGGGTYPPGYTGSSYCYCTHEGPLSTTYCGLK